MTLRISNLMMLPISNFEKLKKIKITRVSILENSTNGHKKMPDRRLNQPISFLPCIFTPF